ncbi:N-acyl homoserine lactonase family protein [Limosilactobacillus sp.]|uniref:N-acyl homoserine lactonase family protein n=1 Tax=Limosilactobacillus sp. TaxID=2773925 RepID=UPI0025C2F212|nr:N-acyl homoserine lactonase family protein [Limosilactobacillus sp.]MCH3922060.1 N-acyl homoserine lactonase family protein [Limosilactobacillus sp.]MCH3928831.1 N-acyl homoserine lactonase family protein [Limosilactobacillus sp.]
MTQPIKIHVLHTGTVIVDEALPFHRPTDRPLAWTGLFRSKKHRVEVPVSVYLIEHPQGLILIDTGWNTVNRDHQLRNLSFQWPVNKANLPAGQAVNEQLAAMGIKTSDLDYVLMSHLHCDHADGLSLVRDAKHILVSEEEWQAANHDHMRYLPHEWKGVPVKAFHLAPSLDGAYHRSFDLFGDGSVKMIWEPGHSAGLCATRVQSYDTDKYVMLAADAGYAAKSWEENLTPGVVIDRAEAQKSLNYIAKVAQDPKCVECLANHDAAVRPHVITL